jgi:ribonucleotide reductase alpha subunit
MQKWVDMGISCNLYYDYENYEDGIIPLSTISSDIVTAYMWGIKTLYYIVTPDGDEDATVCAGGACAI